MQVVEYAESELNEELATAFINLLNAIWPSKDKSENDLVEEIIRESSRPDDEIESNKTRFVIWENDVVVAHAEVFVRRIFTQEGEKDVLALAGVCTDLGFRGRNLGVEIVRAALAKLTEFDLDVCLFQTGVPSFYEKLGGRIIDNRVVNHHHPTERQADDPDANPFWDETVMIYPANADWPTGTIELGDVFHVRMMHACSGSMAKHHNRGGLFRNH